MGRTLKSVSRIARAKGAPASAVSGESDVKKRVYRRKGERPANLIHRGKNSPAKANDALMGLEIIKLRSQAFTFAQIGTKLGIHKETACVEMARAMTDLLDRDKPRTTAHYRNKQWAQCEILVDHLFPLCMTGKDVRAVERLMIVFARMARLRGLDIDRDDMSDVLPISFVSVDQFKQKFLSRLEEMRKRAAKSMSIAMPLDPAGEVTEHEPSNGNTNDSVPEIFEGPPRMGE